MAGPLTRPAHRHRDAAGAEVFPAAALGTSRTALSAWRTRPVDRYRLPSSPRELVDKIMSWYMWPTQMDPARRSVPREDSALWHAGYGMQERGSHVGWHRGGSWAVAAATHPVTTPVSGMAATATAVLSPRWLRR